MEHNSVHGGSGNCCDAEEEIHQMHPDLVVPQDNLESPSEWSASVRISFIEFRLHAA